MKYLQLLLIALRLAFAVQTTVIAADAPAPEGDKTEEGKKKGGEEAEPECD